MSKMSRTPWSDHNSAATMLLLFALMGVASLLDQSGVMGATERSTRSRGCVGAP